MGEQTREEGRVARALRWIAGVLGRANVSFQVVGGLAARAYGATRPLYDIDLYVPGGCLPEVVPLVEEHLAFGPEHVRSEHWDLVFMALEYEGQKIEIGDAASTRIFDRQAQAWKKAVVDFSASEHFQVFGVTVPVMPYEALTAYKRCLAREVDLRDLREMSKP